MTSIHVLAISERSCRCRRQHARRRISPCHLRNAVQQRRQWRALCRVLLQPAYLEEGVSFPVRSTAYWRMKDAETDFGLINRIIPGINRGRTRRRPEMLDSSGPSSRRTDQRRLISARALPPNPLRSSPCAPRRCTPPRGRPALLPMCAVRSDARQRADHYGYHIVEDRQLMQQCKTPASSSPSALDLGRHRPGTTCLPRIAIRQMLISAEALSTAMTPRCSSPISGLEYIKCVEQLASRWTTSQFHPGRREGSADERGNNGRATDRRDRRGEAPVRNR